MYTSDYIFKFDKIVKFNDNFSIVKRIYAIYKIAILYRNSNFFVNFILDNMLSYKLNCILIIEIIDN